jgi:hypothetical protein
MANNVVFDQDESVECSDTIHFCPDKYTCCPTSDNSSFGCCPIDNAICCADGINWSVYFKLLFLII